MLKKAYKNTGAIDDKVATAACKPGDNKDQDLISIIKEEATLSAAKKEYDEYRTMS